MNSTLPTAPRREFFPMTFGFTNPDPSPDQANPPRLVGAPPTLVSTHEIEYCDECGQTYNLDVLTQVMGRGLMCASCIDELRFEGL